MFKRKKHLVYRPRITLLGSRAAIEEFVDFQDQIEKATGKKPRMIDNTTFFGSERIIYILEDKADEQ